MEATATADPNVWKISGAYSGELHVSGKHAAGAAVRFSEPPSADAGAHHGQGATNGSILAPMPGKIVKIAVQNGDAVSAHDLLIVLEAMKMEHRIEAPGDGTVGAVHVREGDIVPGNTLLVELQ